MLPSFNRARLLLLAGSLFIAGCSKPPDAAPAQRLTVGMELAYPPFEMQDAGGNPAGVSVDLANALGEYLHLPVTIENTRFAGLIPALKTGKIDLIISSMTATPERAQSIDFSDPYLSTGLCLLVKKDSPIQSIADADKPGATLVVKQGTTGQIYARDHIQQAQVLVLDMETACALEVAQGKADAFIYDQMSTYANWLAYKEKTRPLLKPFQAEAWAIGIRPGNGALKAKVNDFLKDYRARGGFEKLGDKFLAGQKAAFKEMGVPFVF